MSRFFRRDGLAPLAEEEWAADAAETNAETNAETVSVGNLVLHLCGNLRQYIISTLGGEPDRRTRQAEFDEKGPLPTGELRSRLESTVAESRAVLGRLDPATLTREHRVQGSVQSEVCMLVHVVEHFSYHTGQITFAVKSRKAIDLGYYAGEDLSVTD